MKNYLDFNKSEIYDKLMKSSNANENKNGNVVLFVSAESKYLDEIQRGIEDLMDKYNYNTIEWSREGFDRVADYVDDLIKKLFNVSYEQVSVTEKFKFSYGIISLRHLSKSLEKIINDGELDGLETNSIISYLRMRSNQSPDEVDIPIDINRLIPIGIVMSDNERVKDVVIYLT